ncbi:MAG: 16S rRNA (uracil(1498)-N(3))-methyltransferase [Bacteroidales bacterium]
MQLFYIPSFDNGTITLPQDESRHCIRVLRLTQGSVIQVVDGKGNFSTCKIADPNPKRCIAEVVETHKEFGKRDFHLHIAIAPTKNIDRFEWFLEKATEIGIDEITPMLCEHSERKIIKPERLERVLVAAIKQSIKAYKPKLNPLTPFNEVVNKATEDIKLIGYCNDYSQLHMKQQVDKRKSIVFLVGPEGDFSPEEAELAIKNGFSQTILGSSRLRTETAGVMACAIANTIND